MVAPHRSLAAVTAAFHRSARKRRCYRGTASLPGAADGDPPPDGGTVVGVWLYHRHGDRAPNRYLGSPARLPEETRFWAGRLPPAPADGAGTDATSTEADPAGLRRLAARFPPEVPARLNGGRHAGAERAPFGCLTLRGLEQMRGTGRRLRRRYGGEGGAFADRWRVEAYSTNYLRTVLSAQGLLDGLVGDDRDGGPIAVRVQDRDVDTLNAFDRHPERMNGLVQRVVAAEDFQRTDGAARPLAAALAARLPGLRAAPQAFGGTPSGVNWIHAHDHFACRAAHGVPLTARTGAAPGDAAAEEALAHLAAPVRAHLAWRFRAWYRCPRLLAALAGPPFREVRADMAAATAASAGRQWPFVVYSCHDVTLLALLYAIGADFLVAGEDCGGATMRAEGQTDHGDPIDRDDAGFVRQTSWRWWPAYASTLAFELVQLDGEGAGRSAAADERYGIRVLLNDKALRLIPRMSARDEGVLREQSPSSRRVFGDATEGDTRPRLLRVSEFERVIRVLEAAGEDHGDNQSSAGGSKEEDTAEGIEPRARHNIGVDSG